MQFWRSEQLRASSVPGVRGRSACPVVRYILTWFSGVEIFLLAALSMPRRFFQPFLSPLPYVSFATNIFQCGGRPFLSFCVGAHGWVALLGQSCGHCFNLGAGYQYWKPRDLAMQLWMKKTSKKFRASMRIETKTSALPTEPWNHPRRHSTTNPVFYTFVLYFVTQLFLPTRSVAWRTKERLRNRLARPLL